MKIKDIIAAIEAFAPPALQESYDNAGLITGDREMEAKGVLICLDSTEQVIEEAIQRGCNMVLAHHPIVFSGIKKLTGADYIQRVLIKAIRNNIAIYAAHTNLDNVHTGVNAKIAEKLGLEHTRILSPKKGILKRLITFAPEEFAEKVKKALFDAGAGKIGEYDECSFNTIGKGTFRPSENANPFSGEAGKRSEDKEVKIETVYPFYIESKVLGALWDNHPYEEVAYDIIPLENRHQLIGSGMVGTLKVPMDEQNFLKFLKSSMNTHLVRHTAFTGRPISKVAVCGGSGSFLLKEAIASGVDVFVTADFKYHQFFDAEGKIMVADIGHYESEQFTTEIFYDLLKEKFPTFAVCLSETNTNPIFYL
jgi:dinuclear metal center YbgI/SA1388 family protein